MLYPVSVPIHTCHTVHDIKLELARILQEIHIIHSDTSLAALHFVAVRGQSSEPDEDYLPEDLTVQALKASIASADTDADAVNSVLRPSHDPPFPHPLATLQLVGALSDEALITPTDELRSTFCNSCVSLS